MHGYLLLDYIYSLPMCLLLMFPNIPCCIFNEFPRLEKQKKKKICVGLKYNGGQFLIKNVDKELITVKNWDFQAAQK